MTPDDFQRIRQLRRWALDNGWQLTHWDDGTHEWKDPSGTVLFHRWEGSWTISIDHEVGKADIQPAMLQIGIDTLAAMALIPPRWSATYAAGQCGVDGRAQVWQVPR